MTYAEKLKDPRWQKKRLFILERDDWQCQLCFDTETTLHVHHLSYDKNPWDVPEENLVAYCEHCHLVAESLKEVHNAELRSITKKKHDDGSITFFAFAFAEDIGDIVLIYEYVGNTLTCLFVLNRNMIELFYKKLNPTNATDQDN